MQIGVTNMLQVGDALTSEYPQAAGTVPVRLLLAKLNCSEVIVWSNGRSTGYVHLQGIALLCTCHSGFYDGDAVHKRTGPSTRNDKGSMQG